MTRGKAEYPYYAANARITQGMGKINQVGLAHG